MLEKYIDTINTTPEFNRSNFGLSLKLYGDACRILERSILEYSLRSSSSQRRRRDRAEFECLGQNIDGWGDLLAGYKATLIVAVAGANM